MTVAELLMFGKVRAIQDELAVPQDAGDYREWPTNKPVRPWSDRIWLDGKWEANLFQFFERAYPRLVAELKIPFHYSASGTTTPPAPLVRRDETPVHEAIREAVVHSLIHADYQGQGGIVIERFSNRLEFSNPGTLLLDIEQVFRGSVSECRNKNLQKMFAMLG